MEKDVIKEKLAKAKAHRRQSNVLLLIFIADSLFLSLLNTSHSKTGTAMEGLFWALTVPVLILVLHYGNLVKKYKKQLEESPKEKSKEAPEDASVRVLKLRLAKGEISQEEYKAKMKASGHTKLGVVSLISGIGAIITILIPIFIFGILALVYGMKSKDEDSYGSIGFVLGFISILINTLILILLIISVAISGL